MAFKMMIEYTIHLPEVKITANLWSMKIYYDIFLYNKIPKMDIGLFSYGVWIRSRFFQQGKLSVVFIPAYALHIRWRLRLRNLELKTQN